MRDPLKQGCLRLTHRCPLSCPHLPREPQSRDQLCPSKLPPPTHVHKGGDRQVTFSSERGGKFSYKPVLSIHKQDHIEFGAWQGCETIGIRAKSCSHLQECWLTAQDHVVGSEATRGTGAATPGETPGLAQSNPLGSVALGLPGLRAGAGSRDGYSGGGVAGAGEPPVPPLSQEQAGGDRRTISQDKPRGSVCPKLWANAVG